MSLDQLIQTYRPAIENALHQTVERVNGRDLEDLYEMMAYHLGWIGENAGSKATGKRIRPLLMLLTTQAAGGDWNNSLPAAAAVELIHNFSLIHDDIEDNSPLRRGRPTIWSKWGIPLAINTGDAMFTLAHLTMFDLDKNINPQIKLESVEILQSTCLHLTQGQHLDISYENEQVLPIDAYWPMIRGKTAALISACTEIGALIADVDKEIREAYRQFGMDLGLAFQALDDILGIWGDSGKIGKSIASDLVTGKKSLPVLYGLSQNGKFAKRWFSGPIEPDEVLALASLLETEGAKDYTQKKANRLTDSALYALNQAQPKGIAGKALIQLANKLLMRDV
ncbi:polyprenyl synthetase family protein [Chloroflexota bacterium]